MQAIGASLISYLTGAQPATQTTDAVPTLVDKKIGGVAGLAFGALALAFKSPVVGITLVIIGLGFLYYERKNIAKIAVVSSILGLIYTGTAALFSAKSNRTEVDDEFSDNNSKAAKGSAKAKKSNSNVDPSARVIFTTPEEHAAQQAAAASEPKVVKPPKAASPSGKPPKPLVPTPEIETPKPIIHPAVKHAIPKVKDPNKIKKPKSDAHTSGTHEAPKSPKIKVKPSSGKQKTHNEKKIK